MYPSARSRSSTSGSTGWTAHRVWARDAGHQVVERALQRIGSLRVNVGQIDALARIGLKIVQLAPWSAHELVPAFADGDELAPAVVIARIPRFGEREPIDRLAARRRKEAVPLDLGRRGLKPLEDRRHDVDEADLIGTTRAGRKPGAGPAMTSGTWTAAS